MHIYLKSRNSSTGKGLKGECGASRSPPGTRGRGRDAVALAPQRGRAGRRGQEGAGRVVSPPSFELMARGGGSSSLPPHLHDPLVVDVILASVLCCHGAGISASEPGDQGGGGGGMSTRNRELQKVMHLKNISRPSAHFTATPPPPLLSGSSA